MKKFIGFLLVTLTLTFGVGAEDVYEIEGVCSGRGVNSYGFEVLPKAFSKALDVEVPLLLDHSKKARDIIGKVVHLRIEGKVVKFRALIRDTEKNRDVIGMLKAGELKGFR